MYRTLSPATHCEDLKREARDLLYGARRHEAVAFGRFQPYDPLAALQPRLADAQYIVAREYGYSSWRKLTQRLQAASQMVNGTKPLLHEYGSYHRDYITFDASTRRNPQ